ncbi:ion transporter [Oscillatoria amoena NRMC-F 0135]|nr:ion transporter [Oscillatoria amoena NRMC-F 0135]
MKTNFRKRLYLTLEPKEKGGALETFFEFFLITIILLNILAILLNSIQSFRNEYDHFFYNFEMFSVFLFTAEYIFRIYSIVENPKYKDPIRGRLNYMKTPMAIIDLMAFLPFYLTFLPLDLRFIRIIRLMALFRLFKVARYMEALRVFRKVIYERREQLILSILFIFFILIIISTVMFYVERGEQPNKFTSIPDTMWWGIATLTTVGYGDMVPITPLGRFLGGLFAIAGVGLLALPAGILSSGFFELLHTPKSKKHTCPHCGKEFHD